MKSEQFDNVLHRIRSKVNPQNAWISADGILRCGDNYPEGINYQAVGTYTGTGFDEHQFREDVRFAETVV